MQPHHWNGAMANLITTLRLLLLFVLVWMAYTAPPAWQVWNAPLLVLVFLLDGLDGWVARVRHEESVFGAIYDIAADRVVENVLWLVLADLGLVPIWVAIVFITRGILVDAIRSVGASQGRTPFSLTRSGFGHFLVGGRLMRVLYAALKAAAFGWIFLLQPWPALHPVFWTEWSPVLTRITDVLVYSAVTLCLLRGLPVLIEFGIREGQLLSARPRRRA
jgi:CDP-diacylglycerol---glycerol-3-phosphate 3-phosphatidyltransferase